MDNLLNLMFPPKCVFCENYGNYVCRACLQSCRTVKKFYKIGPLYNGKFLYIFCYFVYENKVRDCIRNAKYSRKQFAVLTELSKYALEGSMAERIKFQNAYVIPVPLSKKKMRYRGFNQAAVVAAVFGKAYGLPVRDSVLFRKKETISQHRLDRERRLKNMRGAFYASSLAAGRSFVLIDDIYTTGATLIEAAESLYKKEALQVTAFTLSRCL